MATVRRIVEASYLRILCRFSNRQPARLSQAERLELLEPHEGALEHDLGLLREVVRQAWVGGVQGVHAQLHNTDGVDHEMLDQAIEFSDQPPGGPIDP